MMGKYKVGGGLGKERKKTCYYLRRHLRVIYPLSSILTAVIKVEHKTDDEFRSKK